MKKGKISFIRLLFSVFAGAVVLLTVAHFLFTFFWHFDILSQRHWSHIWTKWQDGWVLKKNKEIAFFLAVLGMFPAYIMTVVCFYVLPWKNILLFPLIYLKKRKKEKLLRLSLAAAAGPDNKTEALKAQKGPEKVIKISSEKFNKIEHLRGKAKGMDSAGDKSVSQTPSHSSPSIEDEAVNRAALWKKLADTLEEKHVFLFRSMKIKTLEIAVLAVTDEALFLLCEGPVKGNSWQVDENSDNAVWHTENGDIPSPLRPLLTAKKGLFDYLQKEQPQYAELPINLCMILDHGNIKNPDDLLVFLEQTDLSVLRMGSCQTDALPDTSALIKYISEQKQADPSLNDAIAVAILDLMEEDDNDDI